VYQISAWPGLRFEFFAGNRHQAIPWAPPNRATPRLASLNPFFFFECLHENVFPRQFRGAHGFRVLPPQCFGPDGRLPFLTSPTFDSDVRPFYCFFSYRLFSRKLPASSPTSKSPSASTGVKGQCRHPEWLPLPKNFFSLHTPPRRRKFFLLLLLPPFTGRRSSVLSPACSPAISNKYPRFWIPFSPLVRFPQSSFAFTHVQAFDPVYQ